MLAIVGPTASGKSELALSLAERWGGEILSCDSVQIYRGFDIGSGKVSMARRRGIRHHLLDVAEPDQVFTAGDYRREALRALQDIRERGSLPIVVGGTGLYLRALLEGMFEGPTRSDALRARLRGTAGRRGGAFLHRLLARLDAPTAGRIDTRDTQKVIRALEVCFLARRPMSQLLAEGRRALEGFEVLKIGLNPERAALRERIDGRVEEMYRAGWLEEVRSLAARPDAARIKALEGLGYPQALAVVRGEMTREQAIRETQTATRRYAKRQMTWFRREPGVAWFRGFGDDVEVQEQAVEWVRPALSRSDEPGRRPSLSTDREET